jgi:hypothetical protein
MLTLSYSSTCGCASTLRPLRVLSARLLPCLVSCVQRCAFAIGSFLTLAVLALLYCRIEAAADQQELVMTQAELNPPQPMAAMLGAPAAPYVHRSAPPCMRRPQRRAHVQKRSMCIEVSSRH